MQWRNQRRALSNHSCLAEDSTTNHAVLGCGGKHWDQKHRACLGAIIHEKAAESQVSAQVDHDGDFWSIARDVRGSPARQTVYWMHTGKLHTSARDHGRQCLSCGGPMRLRPKKAVGCAASRSDLVEPSFSDQSLRGHRANVARPGRAGPDERGKGKGQEKVGSGLARSQCHCVLPRPPLCPTPSIPQVTPQGSARFRTSDDGGGHTSYAIPQAPDNLVR